MNALIALQFVLEWGSILRVIVTMKEGDAFLEGWLRGTLPDVIGTINPPPGQIAWAVRTKTIQAMHTLSLEQAQAPLQGQETAARLRPNSSGSFR